MGMSKVRAYRGDQHSCAILNSVSIPWTSSGSASAKCHKMRRTAGAWLLVTCMMQPRGALQA
jgi:hypothetical protein